MGDILFSDAFVAGADHHRAALYTLILADELKLVQTLRFFMEAKPLFG
jgi:hypothetical protein